MTLEELSYKFFKAHILMGMGTAIGAVTAETFGLSYPLTIGLLTGLLFSIHVYRKCIMVLIIEYKRLRTRSKIQER